MSDILRQSNGMPWLTDKGETVPAKCPNCGANVGLFLMGEPVFICTGIEEHYFGTLKFPGGEEEE